MARQLVVGNTPFNYPDPGDSPGWGQDATGWAQAVTDELSTVANINDISETAFSIANNILVLTDISSLLFNNSTVRAVEITYSIYRVTNLIELGEEGTINIIYKNTANTWYLDQRSGGDDSGVLFSITNSGQMQYTSSNVSGTSYSGIMKFRAKTLSQ